jgi:DNA-binding protein YbaB
LADLIRNPQSSNRVDTDHRRDAEMVERTASASAGAGLVQVQVNGRGVLRSLVIAPEAFAGRDSELLADLVMSAITEAQRRLSDSE